MTPAALVEKDRASEKTKGMEAFRTFQKLPNGSAGGKREEATVGAGDPPQGAWTRKPGRTRINIGDFAGRTRKPTRKQALATRKVTGRIVRMK